MSRKWLAFGNSQNGWNPLVWHSTAAGDQEGHWSPTEFLLQTSHGPDRWRASSCPPFMVQVKIRNISQRCDAPCENLHARHTFATSTPVCVAWKPCEFDWWTFPSHLCRPNNDTGREGTLQPGGSHIGWPILWVPQNCCRSSVFGPEIWRTSSVHWSHTMASQCGWWESAFALPSTEPFLHPLAWKLMDYEGPDSAVEKVCCNRWYCKNNVFITRVRSRMGGFRYALSFRNCLRNTSCSIFLNQRPKTLWVSTKKMHQPHIDPQWEHQALILWTPAICGRHLCTSCCNCSGQAGLAAKVRPKTKDLEPKIAIGEMLGNINWQCIHVKMHSSIHILKGFQFVFDQLHTFWMQDLHLCAPALMFLNPESTHLKKNRAWSKMCGYMIRAPGSMVSWREMIQIDCPGIEANHGAPVCLIAGPVNPLAFRGAKTAYWIPTTKLFCRQCTTWYPLHVLVGLNLEAKNKSRGKGLIVVLVHAVVLQVMRVPLMGSGLLGCAYVFYGKPEWILWSKLTFPSSYTFSVCQPWLLCNSCP